ncbi:flagellar hook protein FlgE [Allochromatium tepidum]|uniref:Flagellar hook protein FlgE n=1 Tax=Allochromatium tepidum TaxID=553982 RepID=A0ABN6GDV3_9GAMM|nr:flagellar hook protein FlgE [Allochromatium tepidum]BCU07652.1 flagellar hook protein FlgE [Allochromatium tepidum]
MSFSIGLSGLRAAAKDLEVTGNNIANSATIGFKKSRAEFADIYASSFGTCANKSAVGVRLAAVTQQFSQGNLELTGNTLDLAVNGEGFFVLRNETGQNEMVYTRNGTFQVDRDGYVVSSAGKRLQVYPPQTPNSNIAAFSSGNLTDLQLPLDNIGAKATTEVDINFNLNADAEVIADAGGPAFGWPALPDTAPDPNSYNWSTTYQVYDSLGSPRDVTMYFVKTGPLTWDVHVGMYDVNNATPPEPPVMIDATGTGGPVEIVFKADGTIDTVNGATVPDTAAVIPISMPAFTDNGADALVSSIKLDNATQYSSSKNSVIDLTQNGYSAGTLSGFDVDTDGIVFARYSNGQSHILGQVAMANFKNPQGLAQIGDNNWAQSYGSGEPVYGAAGDGRLGSIQSCALENSNVDLTEELVNMITAQRNYEANAKTISTADQMTQTILNLR